MTKKDFILIAEAIREFYIIAEKRGIELTERQKELLLGQLEAQLYESNDRFDAERFENYINKK